MSNIISLPPEIIYQIGSYLSIADNKILRYVCQYISQIVEPLALSSLTFCLKASTLYLYSEKLNAYGQRTTKAASHVRKLAVVPQNQLMNLHLLRAEEWSNNIISRNRGIPVEPPPDHQQLLQIFLNLLTSLDKVDAFDWYLHHDISEQVTSKIISFLSSSSIKKLKIMFNRPAPVPDSLLHFDHPWSMRELAFTDLFLVGGMWTHPRRVQLARLPSSFIANCPNLERLCIQTPFFNATPLAPRLHDFLPHDTSTDTGVTTRPPLRLKDLSVTCLRVHLDQSMLYHLRSLQRLRIRSPLTTPEHGDSISTIMRTLRTEGIHLRELNLNTTDVDSEVIEYLLSYANTGIIQEVSFENKHDRTYSDTQEASIIAERFFAEALPAVAGSLRFLHITTIDRFNSWTFNPSYVESIRLCHKLENLCLSVDAEANKINNIEEVLKGTKRQLPLLHSLEIDHIPGRVGIIDMANIW